ncbi:hypothetical protein LOZ58_004611 [Ophidiomyces ophidiicola]|nr:hypothetical protein LOZ58_004611 [Ophidiomyces ophidiicola]
MASQPQKAAAHGFSDSPSNTRTEPSLNDRFFRYFQQEIIALQGQMGRLADTSTAGGESKDAIDHCLAGIARLSSEVQDASSYLSPYDQRVYAEAIKALQEKLAETRAAIAPRQKFSFKTARKNRSAVSLADVAELDAAGRRHIPGYQSGGSSAESSVTPNPAQSSLGSDNCKFESSNIDAGGKASTPSDPHRRIEDGHFMPKEGIKPIVVHSKSNALYVLPAITAQPTIPASITSIRSSLVDMTTGQPFAVISLRDVTSSLILCGEINGAAHVTGVRNSVILVSCHQFRMHDCADVDVYLGCSSTPIIEGCNDIRFTHMPAPCLSTGNHLTSRDAWAHVDDFSWLKYERSPNWRMLDEAELLPDSVWSRIYHYETNWPLEKILKISRRLPDDALG